MFEHGGWEAGSAGLPSGDRDGMPEAAAVPAVSAVRDPFDGFEPAPNPSEHEAARATEMALLSGAVDDGGVAGIQHLEGCSELASWLVAVDTGRLGDFDLVEVVAGFERVASWAKARAAAAAAELARRPAMNPVWPAAVGRLSEPCAAPLELSLRLGVSRSAASRLVSVGRLVDGPLQATGRALEEGRIDWGKAVAVCESLADSPWQVALQVEDAVLPEAPGRTHSQLRRDLERALVDVDPRDADERHGRALDRRRVERPQVLPDGMASIRAIVPAEAAVRLDATLQGAAVAAHAAGDPRTVAQLRADALDAMAGVAWATGWIGDPDAAPARSAGGSARPRGDGESVGRRGAMRVGTVGGRRAQVMVTVGMGTLLGLDERPAELEGYGPIGADVARRIAMDGTWRRLLVDPVDGVVMDVGTTRYRPPADLAELIRARNPFCVVPTCSTRASRCDIDHTIPFTGGMRVDRRGLDGTALGEHGGGTSADNLGPLCRTEHLFKTHGGFELDQDGSGAFELRTPTGHSYVEPPVRPPGVPPPDPPGSPDEDQAPPP